MNSYGHSFEITFDIAPSHILSQEELGTWLNSELAKPGKNLWWWRDLLGISYRSLESKARAISAQDPQRAQQEIRKKKETANMKAPPDGMIKHLASHGIQYTGKIFTNNEEYTWRFAIKDPNSALSLDFPVPAGSSESAVIAEAYKSTSGSGIWSGAEYRKFLH
jgi:hypothetical protein